MIARVNVDRRLPVRALLVLSVMAGLLLGPLASPSEAGVWYTGPSKRCTYTDNAPWKSGDKIYAVSRVQCKWKIKAIEHIVELKRYTGWAAPTLKSGSRYCADCRSTGVYLSYYCKGTGKYTYFTDVEVRVHFYDGTRGEWARGYSPYVSITC
ncbi:MAG: hypothetical protein GEU94_15980 [Micromonosporaceae bacterium]|nr:hypothetical protein [Micromonosporaceae bacterium]